MRTFHSLTLLASVALLAAACADFGEPSVEHTGGQDDRVTTGSGGSGGTGWLQPPDGGGREAHSFQYSEHCGAGCLPGSDECALDGFGGSGGDGGGHEAAPAGDCKLLPNGLGGVVAECSYADDGDVGAECLEASHCGAGLGCVDSGCRPYCCGDVEECPDQSYCALRPMKAMGADSYAPTKIPVCVPATPCQLLEPCLELGKVCTIVRMDGTTSCVEPGDGKIGEACPCAEGYFCATGTNTCHKLCRLGHPGECPSEMTCQAGPSSFPQGIGVCVG